MSADTVENGTCKVRVSGWGILPLEVLCTIDVVLLMLGGHECPALPEHMIVPLWEDDPVQVRDLRQTIETMFSSSFLSLSCSKPHNSTVPARIRFRRVLLFLSYVYLLLMCILIKSLFTAQESDEQEKVEYAVKSWVVVHLALHLSGAHRSLLIRVGPGKDRGMVSTG